MKLIFLLGYFYLSLYCNQITIIMTLVVAVTNILNRRVSEEEAKDFALKQYGLLAAYIRSQQVTELLLAKDPNYKEKMQAKKKAIHKVKLKAKKFGIDIK